MGSEFAILARPLQHLRNQKASFQWTAAHSSAVHALKDGLIHYTKLSLPDLTRPFILRAYSFGVAIGAMLEQDNKHFVFLVIACLMPKCAIQPRCPVYDHDPQHASSKVLSVSSLSPTAPQQSCISASDPLEPAALASLLLVLAKVGRPPKLQIESNTSSGPSQESPSPLLHDNVQASPQSSLSDPEMQGVGDWAWEVALQHCSEFGAAYKRAKVTQPEPHLGLPTAGHSGISKTYSQISMKLYWKGIRGFGCFSVDTLALGVLCSALGTPRHTVKRREPTASYLHWDLPTTARATLLSPFEVMLKENPLRLQDLDLADVFPPTLTLFGSSLTEPRYISCRQSGTKRLLRTHTADHLDFP
ncbi:hypothetical protein Esti_002353 [Eimeria stiedai]